MGIFIGSVEILLGLVELWAGASIDRLFRWKMKGYHARGFAFIGCGCLSILICACSGFWNFRLDGFTYFAEMGGLILYGSFQEIFRVRSCKMEVDGIFSHFSPTLGMMPVFTYRVGKNQYRGTSQPCSMEKYRTRLKPGEIYPIFVNERKPDVFALTRQIERSNYFTIPVGAVLIVPWLVYCWGLFTK